MLAYAGLFLVALAAATILPLQSEAAVAAMLLTGHSPWLVLLVASVGNVLGSTINWVLGRAIDRYGSSRWFPASGPALERASRWYRRYGRWSLLLSWAPIIGDPITVVAGVLRERLPVFLLLVTIAKVGRYVAVIAVTLGLS